MNRATRFVASLGLLVYGVFASQGVSQAPASNTWTVAGHLTQARSGAAAVLLTDGRVLITGGTDKSGVPQATAEVYDPVTGTFTASTAMNVPRANHAAIVLKTGDVLVTGGLTTGGGYSDSAEIYSVSSKQWTLLPSSLGTGLAYHAMAQLSDGNILIAGGTSTSKVVGSLVLFNLTDQNFMPIGMLQTPRTNAVAAATPDGRVLIAGGTDVNGAVLASTEMFVYNKDTMTGSISSGPTMTFPRVGATATSTYDGVAVIGGNNGQIDLGTAEIFSQWTNTFKTVSGGTPRSHHFAALLPKNGSVLVMGGTGGTAVDLLQPWANKKAGAFVAASESLINQDGGFASPASLGSLLAAGGKEDYASASELYWFPTISTDKPDYAPGKPVHMTGTGFQPFESVTLHIHEWVKQSTDDDPDVTVAADSFGNFTYDGYAPDTNDLGARYHLTAVGMSSGYQAQVIFTDSIINLNFTNAPLDQATNACGQLTISSNAPDGQGTIYLTDSTSTGAFYNNSLCTGTAITSIAGQSTVSVYYKNTAPSTPTLYACSASGGVILCFLEGAALAQQNESIYGPPTQIVFTTQPGGGTPGAVWAVQPVVAVQDANYNTVSANSDPITLTLSTNPGGTLSCASNPQNASSGTAAFSNCLVSVASSSSSCYRLTAKDTTLNFSVVSNCFYIENAANAGNSTVSATPNPAVDNGNTPGQNPPGGSTITVTLKDSGGALLGNKAVTLTAGSGNSNINTVSGTTNSNGVATFTVSDNNPEVVTYTALDVTDNIQITQKATVTFAAGPVSASTSTVRANPTTVQADGVATSTITVTLQDSSGDAAAGYTVTLGAGSGSSVITPVSGTTNASGVITFTVKDAHVESVIYTASYSSTNDSGTLSTHTVTVNFVAVPTTLNLTLNPNSITFGTPTVALSAGLSVTSGGAPVGTVAVSFYRGAVGSNTCNTSSTPLGTVATDGSGTAPLSYPTAALPVGVYRICAFSAAATVNNISYAAASSSSQTLTVGQASNFVWTTTPPASAVYNTTFPTAASSPSGTGHSPCTPIAYGVSGGACSINGSHVVTMTSGGGLPPGSLTCTVTANLPACQSGGTTYGPATLTAVVTPVLATQTTLVINNASVPTNAGDGATFTPTTSGGSGTGAVTISTSTPTVCSVSGNTVTMTATGGGQTCTITATKASDGNYASATSASKSTVSNGSAVVQITNTAQTYTGSPLPVTVTTIPAGLSYSVVYSGGTCGSVTDPNCPTLGPTLVGTYSVTAQITTSGVTGSSTTNEIVSQLSPGLVLALQTGTTNPSPYGKMAYFTLTVSTSPCPTGTVQLTVDTTNVGTTQAIGCSIPLVFSTATIEPGTHNVVVQYGGDSNHAPSQSNTLVFTVSANTTSVTLTSTTTPVFVGQSITFTATVGPTSLDPSANGPLGQVQFYDGATPLGPAQELSSTSPYTASYTATLAQGSHSITATYIPGSDAEFAGSSSAIEVAVVQYITPVLAWPTPANIVYGTPLSDVQLNATATDPINTTTVAGVFTYTPAANTVLAVGTTTLSVSFQATDTATYGTVPVTMTVPITITGATLLVTADNQTMPYGGPIPTLTYTITGFVAGDVPSQVTGAALCSTTTTVTSPVSGSPYTNSITCQQASLAEPNYTFTFAPGTMTVTTATPTVSLGCQEVTFDNNPHGCQGVAIGADGLTPVTGNWVYNPVSETNPGSYPVTGTFTSSDPNYVSTPLTASATLVIDIASSSVTLTCPPSVPYNGTAQTPCSATAVGSGGLSQTLTVNYTNNTNFGTATATASFGGDTGHTASSNTVTFAISPAAVTVQGGSYTGVYDGNSHPPSACTVTGAGGFTGGITCTNNPLSVGPDVSSGAVLPVPSGGSSNFTITSVNGLYSITQAVSTVNVTCPSSVVYNGSAQTPCTASVTGVGGLSIDLTASITYGSNSGVGTASATASFAGDTDHAPGTKTVNFAITAAGVTVTGGSLTGVYTGLAQPLSACTVTGSGGNTYIGGLFCTNNPLTEGPAVGSGPVPVSALNMSGDTLTNFAITYVAGSWSITKATSTVAVSCPPTVAYNGAPQTPCTATVTGANLNQAVTPVTYTSNTNVGTVTASATFAGDSNHNSDIGSATFNIIPAAVTATAGSGTWVYNTLTETIPPCTITGVAFATGLTCANIPPSVGPNVTSGTVTPNVTGDTGNFTITPVTGNYSITQALATLTLGNLAQFYTGSPVAPVTVQTSPLGLAVVSVLYGTTANPTIATSTTVPTAVGSYAVSATLTNLNYFGSASGTLVISTANLNLTLALHSGTAEPSLYGQSVEFDLTLTGTPCPTGTVTWTLDGLAQTPVSLPATCSGPVTYVTDTLQPGSHTLSAAYSGDGNYAAGPSNQVTHVVAVDTTTVTLAVSPTTVNVGQPVTFTAVVAPTLVPGSGALVPTGTVQFYDGATPIGSPVPLSQLGGSYLAIFSDSALAVGPHTISATYVSTDPNEYPGSSSTVNVTVTVGKIVPNINWTAPASIVYGTALGATQLSATATDPTTGLTVPGTLTYVPNAGTILPVGTTTLAVTFAPLASDSATYAGTGATVTITVTAATPTLLLTCPAATYNGNPQQTCVGSETGVAGGNTPTGTWTYNPTTETEAGTYSVTGTFTSTNPNYQSGGTATGTLIINKAAVTARAGSFTGVYTGNAVTIPACAVTGTFTGTLTCTNNPASVGPGVGGPSPVLPVVSGGTLADFAITSVNGSYSITKAPSTVTVTCTGSFVYNGLAQTPCSATVTGAGGLSQPVTPVTYTNNTNAGTATASATYAGDANHAGSTGTANFTISPAPVTATAGSYNSVYDGAAHATAPTCAVTGAFTGGLTCTNNPATVGPAVGSGTVTPTVTGGTLTNFTITAVTGTWSITKATSTVTVSCPASITYNGAAQTPCTANVTGAGGLNQTLTVNYTNNTNAGTATASAAFAGDASHTGSSNTANFTINPAAVTATAGSFSGVYNGAARTPSACAVTGAFKGSLTCTNNPASVGPAVSSGAVLPVVSGGSANFTITLVNGSWSITQATSTVTVTCPATVTYNGAAQTPCTAAVTGAGGLNQPVTPVTYTNNTNAGTATASASFAGDANHAGSTNTANFTINPAPVTATAGGYSGVYDGSSHATAPACAVTGTYKGALTCTNSLTTVGPAVGSGAVTPVVTGGSANFAITLVNGAWSITKAPSTVALTCPASVTYNGAAQTPCTAAVTGAGGLNQAVTPVTYTNNTNAGTATASASFAGDANHAASSNTANFTISPAAVTATAGGYSGVYDGAAHATAPACAVTGAFTGGLTCTNNPASVGPAAGSGAVTPTVTGGTANFTITAVNGAWSITKATSTVTLTCPASVAYNGAAQTPCTATVTGAGGLSQSLTPTYTNNINAGTATASASFAGDANHAAASNTASFTINAAAVTATAGGYTGVYDGSSHAPSACAVTGTFTGGLTCTNTPASVGPGVGSGAVTPTVSGGTSNFTITTVNGAWSITQATSTVTVTCPASVAYNGVAQTPCTSTVTGAGGLSQSLTVSYTNNTNAGTATASASFAGDTNHAAGSNTASFTINPAAVTATAGSYSAAYDGSAHAPSACAVTGAYTGSLTCTNTPASVGPGVGSGTVTPSVSGGTSNFTITTVNGAWSITGASSTVTLTCPASVVYNGAAQTPCTATVTGAGGLSQSVTVTYTNNTNAGTATANASFAGDANHSASSNSANFTINPATVTATAGSYSGVYDGSTHTTLPLCALAGSYTGSLTCANSPASVGPGIGSGTVTPTVTGGSANFAITSVNGSWSITNATSTVTVTCPASVTFNGAAQTPCTATVTGVGGLNQSVTVTYSNNTNAGTATANASFAGDTNHSASSNSKTFTINPVGVTATAGSYSGTADGSAHSPSACLLTGAYTVGLTCTNNPASVGPAVGSGTVTPVVTGGSANFAITPINGSWNITQAALTPTTTTVICPASVGYNGTAQTPCTATVTGSGGLNQSLTVTYANNTNAGTATANASYVGDATYASSSNSATFTINPVAVTATAGSYSAAFDGSAHSPSACLLTGAYTVGLTCTNNPASVGPGIGSGTVSPNVTGGAANFTVTPVAGSWSITNATSSVALSCPASVGYNGAAQAPCTATVTGAGALSQSVTVTYSNNTNAGTATANASFAGDANHSASNNSTTFTIDPAAVTATAGSYSGTADGSAHSPSACLLTGSYTVGLSCTNNPASVGPAVGSGTVTPVVTGGSANFVITPVNGSWSITQGALTPTTTTVICPASVGFNGAAQTPCTATVTGAGGLNQSLTVSYANNSNAGTATANASFAGNTTYASSSNSTNFTINPAAVTATAGSYSGTADGSAHSPSACLLTGAYTVGLTCTNNPASVGPAVGSGTVTPVVTGGTANFVITPVNGSWSITQGALTPTTTTVICPASVGYNGAAQTPCTATVTGSGGLNQSLAVTYANNTNAGTATANASFAGNTTYASSSNSATFTINPAAVTATAGSYVGIDDGSAHATAPACAVTGAYTGGLTCTNNPASVGPGTGSGTVTPVVTGGSANFAITAVNGSWSITQAALTPTTTTVICPASVIYSGAAQTPCAATVTAAGGFNQSLTVGYTNNLNAGTATASASFAGDTTHAASSNSKTFTITQAPAIVTVTNLAQYFTGSPLPVTVSTTPTGLSVTVLYSSSTYPSTTTAPTNPGTYSVSATVVDSNYVGQDTESLVIYPAGSGLTLQLRSGMPEPSLYGTMAYFDLGLGGTPCPTGPVQFYVDGTASGSAVTLNGSSCSSPVTYQTAMLEPGSHSVYAAYSGDTLHSAGNSNTVTHAVTADTTAVTLATSATSVSVGQPVTFMATVTPSSLDPSANGPAGTVQFFDGSTSLGIITLSSSSPYTAVLTTSSLGAGTHSISANYVSSGGEFTGSSSSISVTVTAGKIAPTITWANPANIVYGTALSGTQLNATATDATNGNIPVAGTFTYTPLAGTVLPVGTVNLQVSFTPTDTSTYSTQTATVTLTVTAVTPTLSLTCAEVTYDGNPHACVGTVTGVGGATVGGSWSYTPASETAAGSYPVTGTFTSTDGNYQGGTATGTLKIDPAAVTATAGSYNGVVDASSHAPSACAVTGAYTGSLSCTNNPASVGPAVGSGTVLPVVSGGTANFAITLVNGSWNISVAPSTTTTVSCPASVIYSGLAQTPCTATVTGSGGFSQTLTVSYTNNTNAGTATASASFAGDTNHAASSNSGSFAINPAPVTATAGSYSGVVDASAHSPSACAVTGAYTGSLSCTNNPASVGPAVGSGTVLPVVSGGTLSNFAITAVNGAWSITQAALTPTTTTVSCPASVGYSGLAQTPCTATVTGSGGLSQSLTVSYTNNTNAGTATASASYAGNTTYASSSNTANFTINPAAVTATAGSYNGVVDASSHAPSACAVTGAYTGSLSCTNNPASVGPAVGSGTVLPVVSGGTANFAITLVNGSWNISVAPSTTTTVSCPASVIYSGLAQTPCTATVTGSGGFSQTLTVSYTNNTNAGTATASASFAGDASHAASSNSASFTINPASQAITFTQPTSPVIYGVSPITLSATGGASGMPVVFSIDASSTGSGIISGSTLTVTGVGNVIIDANQAGNSNYLAATQVTRSIVVNLAALTVAANNASRVYGIANPAFTGSVTGALKGDTYTETYSTIATINSNVGTYPIVPSAVGANLSDYAVTVQNGILTITQAGTTTSMNASSSSVTPGQTVTLTAQVASATTGTPTGSVTFYDGTTLLATVPLTAGTATMSTGSLTAGSANTLQAVYSGDNNFTTSTSSISSVTVASLDFTVAVLGSPSNTVQPGTVATYQVALTPLYGNYPGQVSFAASGLPSGASVTFSPSTIAFDGGKQTIKVTVQTPAAAKLELPGIGRKLAPLTLAFLLIPLFGARKLRRQGRRLSRLACLMLLLGCSLAGVVMTGCGGAAFKQSVQTYTVTVTSTSGNMQHSASVTLVVE